MQGFSFVDDAFKSRRNEKRLEERLEEERVQRKFMRDMATERNTRANAQEEDRVELHDQALADRDMQDEAAAIYSQKGPNGMSQEELRKYGRFSPRVQAELDKRVRRGEMTAAATELHGLGFGAQQVTADTTGAPPASAPAAAADEAAETSQDLFAPARDVVEIDADEFRSSSRRYQSQGLVAQARETVAGIGANIADLATDVVPVGLAARQIDKGFAAAAGAEPRTQAPAVGAAFGGNVYVPADRWTSDEDLANMGVDERAAAMAEREAVVEEYEARAESLQANKLIPNVTVHGGISDVSREVRNDAINYQNNAINTFQEFVTDPQSSSLQQVAQNSPQAALSMYYEMRNTVHAANPQLAAKVDYMMYPLMTQQRAGLAERAVSAPAGGAEARRVMRAQANLTDTINDIYRSQPNVNQQAGVVNGLSPGDAQRVGQVTDIVNDPNRVRPVIGTVPQSQSTAALTVAGRITPNRRINDKQMDALVTALDLGMIDSPTFQSVLMTGAWPPGKDPNGIKSMQKGDDGYFYAITNNGGMKIIPTNGVSGKGKFESEEFTADTMDIINKGFVQAVGNPENVTPEMSAAVSRFVINNAALLRNTFTVNSEEQQMLMGHLIHNAYIARRHDIDENYGGWNEPSADKAPPLADYVFNTDVRRELLKDLANQTGRGVELVEVPPRVRGSNFDHQATRNAIAEGELAIFGFMPGTENNYSPDELVEITYVALELQKRMIEDQTALKQR
jgi:hypothetical protein